MKTFIKTLLFSTLCICISAAVFAQGSNTVSSISGKILKSGNAPVEFATVTLLKAKDSSLVKGAIATIEGKYEFENIKAGHYIIAGYHVGMDKVYSSPFEFNGQHLTIPSIVLNNTAKNLKSVEVTAKKPFVEQHADKMVINVESSIVGAGGTAMEVLEKSPTIMVDKDDNITLKGKGGVIIMIDGKITNMSSQDVAQLLKSMPSSNVETIELIANPSAKYDAAGNAGIINIKLKKNKNFGTNGSINVSAGYGEKEKLMGSMNLNYRNEKINVYGSYNHSYRENINNLSIDRTLTEGSNKSTRFNQSTDMDRILKLFGFKAGADYFINKNHTVGIMIDGNYRDFKMHSYGRTQIGQNNMVDSVLRSHNYNEAFGGRTNFNVNYKGVLDKTGKELNVDLDYGRNFIDQSAQFYSQFFDGIEKGYLNGDTVRSQQPATINVYTFKADYVQPLKNKAKFEAGVKISFVESDNKVRFDSLKTQGWIYDNNRSNHFIYRENISAAYVNFNKQYEKWGYQIGLRGENTHVTGDSYANVNRSSDTTYFNLFPSVFINYNLDKNNTLNFSYSRRLRRPSYESLNPFEFFLDKYTKEAGNPYLKPEYANNFEISHNFKQMVFTSIGYTYTNNSIMNIVVASTDPISGDTTILTNTKLNGSSKENIAFNISAPIQLFKWWKIMPTASVYYNSFKVMLYNKLEATSSMGLYSQLQNTFTITKTLSAELTGNYISPQIADQGMFRMEAMYGVDLGMRKQLFGKRATLNVNVQDIFKNRMFRGSQSIGGQEMKIRNRWESRQINVSFNYRFGNMNVKESRKRKAGLEEEASRM
ncbi:outer membrane receptor protein involved in Fe transport [Chitinophaga skermanii]|uniref:Outer membrane receptor protein involved in Fe transport n=1 Tax=Chitinophaga skermanii TaxID=331697 RepID=A0A327QFZ1_9BACT|nr:TonB-dependent receptor [Chitinophaga skermanii]RAJ02223.1 outer membrane receptor protein involved in Fe transport [Chitinophaga skermanii]